jgi:hypothetical protein
MKILSIALMGMLLMGTSGCLSAWSLDSSKHELALQKAIMSNNETAIRAVRLGDDGVGFGIDISNLSALKEHPLRQIGAAIGDAAIIWGAYEGVKSISNSNSNNEGDKNAGRDNNDITINGDNNKVNVGDNKDNTTAAGE